MDPEAVKYADPVFTKSLYLFACTNSCANPIVYGIFNLKRKRTEKNTVKKFTITFRNNM
jgi:gonadotropin-releasing hormone receptor